MPAAAKPGPAKASPAPVSTVTIGRIVLYRLDVADAVYVNKQRREFQDSPPASWGYQAHTGTLVHVGDEFPAVVVKVAESGVNLKVLLDGNDNLWARGIGEGDGAGQWHWPPRA